MKRGFILFLLIFSKITYAYGPEDINLSDYEFRRYVIPQLISIKQDYRTLFFIINPELKSLKAGGSYLGSVQDFLQTLSTTRDKEKRLDKIRKAQKELSKFIILTSTPPSLLEKEFLLPQDFLHSQKAFLNFQKALSSFSMSLDHYSFLVEVKEGQKVSPSNILAELSLVKNSFDLYLLTSSDYRFRNEFISFHSEFLKPVTQLILPERNKQLFIQKLNEFNLRLNFLNVVLTKRNKKVSRQATTLLNIMHNRWNNILKVTIRK
ncbi:MAG: hypothetical protein QF441_07405 [Bacteriovoracaceae bacterium]|jgi:hypothetical protein|nr:hypothetical protein [Halobacteriovoraceae bacterium]MDP7320419.1 hypothetical protein [Bacteriovoracaceae bacterium]